MKKLSIISIALSFLYSGLAHAVQIQGNATVQVVTPIAIDQDTALNFGVVAPLGIVADPGQSVGTVTIATDNSVTSNNISLLSQAPNRNRGVFTVTGTSGATYAITIPSGNITLNDGGSNNITVGSFTSNPSGTGVLTGGTQTLHIGATLTVAANQAAGTYSGTYPITVEYN